MDKKFKKIIAENLNLNNLEEITENATLNSLGADSLDIAEISLTLE